MTVLITNRPRLTTLYESLRIPREVKQKLLFCEQYLYDACDYITVAGDNCLQLLISLTVWFNLQIKFHIHIHYLAAPKKTAFMYIHVHIRRLIPLYTHTLPNLMFFIIFVMQCTCACATWILIRDAYAELNSPLSQSTGVLYACCNNKHLKSYTFLGF